MDAAMSMSTEIPPKSESYSDKKSEVNDQKTLFAVLQFLKKNNLTGTADLLEKEAQKLPGCENIGKVEIGSSISADNADVSSLLSSYSNRADPSSYVDNFIMLRRFVEVSLDSHKWELSQFLYPVFVHMYLELLYNNHSDKARQFYNNFNGDFKDFHSGDVYILGTVSRREHMERNDFMNILHKTKYVIRISKDSQHMLNEYIREKNLPLVKSILHDHMTVEVFDGLPRSKKQIRTSSGGMCGDVLQDANKTKVYYGLLKEPDLDIPVEDEQDEIDTPEGTKPKKKKKREVISRKNKADPNAPSLTRIPLPEMKDADKVEKITMIKESMKRVRLGGSDSTLPSICCYTLTNAFGVVTAVDICDDSTRLAAGFQSSIIRVWSLSPATLRGIRSSKELMILDKEQEDIFDQMMDGSTAKESRSLCGHTGAVYAVSFSPCRNYLVSSSEDGTVRLWCLLTWTNLVIYKGHMWPSWCVQFGPHGYYFASGGQDRVARLWVTDHPHPVRIFAGHLSDVDCVQIHPNSNYLATGSSDRTVRVWDVLNGNCVRIYTGHKDSVQCLSWSPDGRYLASGGADKLIFVWDIANKKMVAQFEGHQSTVYTLRFSRDNEVIASSGTDKTIKIWDVQQAISDFDNNDMGHFHTTLPENNYLLTSIKSKSLPIQHLQFTRRNLLLACGVFSIKS